MMFIWLILSIFLTLASCSDDSIEHGSPSIPGPRSTNCTCGVANRDSARIIQGFETKINEYPFMAGLVNAVAMIVFCGGVVITEKHVLTAAHCTLPKKQRKFGVTLGDHDVDRKSETEGTVVINVVRTIEHELYSPLAHHNDIALCVLEKNIDFNTHISRICYPTSPVNLVGKNVRVIGWGRTSAEGKGSNVLLQVDLNVVPLEQCSKHYPIKTPPKQFCTFRQGYDSCKGDSGGPLFYLDEETNRYTLAGLVSYGRNCAGGTGGERFGAVNTDAASYIDWVSNHIGGAATCNKV